MQKHGRQRLHWPEYGSELPGTFIARSAVAFNLGPGSPLTVVLTCRLFIERGSCFCAQAAVQVFNGRARLNAQLSLKNVFTHVIMA